MAEYRTIMQIQARVAGYRRYSLNTAALLVWLWGVPAFSQTLKVVYPSRTAESQRLSDIRGGSPAVHGPAEIKHFKMKEGNGGGTVPAATVQTSYGTLANTNA